MDCTNEWDNKLDNRNTVVQQPFPKTSTKEQKDGNNWETKATLYVRDVLSCKDGEKKSKDSAMYSS